LSARELKVERLESAQAVVSLIGDHDTYSAHRIESEVCTLLEEGFDVEIDLLAATFIDSTVVGTLIEASRLARELHRRFSVVIGETTGWAVRRLFELTQLESYLGVSRD
jgi:anti-sigma B factor antagonist